MSKRKRDDFVHLHVHSDMSQLDGAGKLSDYIKEAVRRGNPALAFTDHGTMRGFGTFIQEVDAEQLPIKPIAGIEFYVARDMRRRGLTDEEKAEITKGLKKSEHRNAIKEYEEIHGIRDRWHLTCWALTDEGIRNLYKLSSKSWIEGFYYKPRVDLEALIEHNEGLAVSTGCLSSPINDLWLRGRKREAIEFAERLREAFGDRLYLEVQPHSINDPAAGGLIQHEANKLITTLRKRWGSGNRLLATQDSHYIHQSDWEHHEVLLCIGTGDVMSNPNRFKFDGDQFHFRTRKEMEEAFKKHHGYIGDKFIKEALDTTLEFADRVTGRVTIDRFKCLVPEVEVPPEYANEWEFIRGLCVKGWAWRDIDGRAEALARREHISPAEARKRYMDRLKYELSIIKRQKFVGYFLVVRDLYDWARRKGIACGPGRGSAAGSLVSYLLGITSVDPLEHRLLFERFVSPDRIDMPDIDMDFEDARREEVIQYLIERYGRDKVAQIATIGKLSGKQCLKDVARVLEVPYADVNAVTNSIIERSSGDERASQTIEDSFRDFKVCREFNEKYPKVLYHAKHLEGMAKTLGIHAAGVVASPVPLTDVVPLETRQSGKGEPVIVTAYDMHGVQAMGLLKLDVLGLKTMTILREACDFIERRHGFRPDLERLDLNEPDILQGFTDHDYAGIFQYDTPSADKICAGVEFVHFEDVAAMTALNRPGTARSGLATEYVKRKKNPKLAEKDAFHPKVSEITSDTLGIIVYQEHVLRIFVEIAGFAPASADSLRKKIAKKWGDETIGKERENFISGAMKKTPGMTEEIAGRIMDAITFFGCVPGDTGVITPEGPVAIQDIRPGDAIISIDKAGRAVRNRAKAVAPTGSKEVWEVRTNHVVERASSEHWWLVRGADGRSHEYKKTKDLVPGDLIAYATNLDCVAREKPCLGDDYGPLFGEGVCATEIGARDVLGALPESVQEGADGERESGRLAEQQVAGAATGEGVEGREDEGAPVRGGASSGDLRAGESGVERRARPGLSTDARGDSGGSEAVREVRGGAGSGAPGAEHEDAPHTPQGSGRDAERPGESGGDLSEVPQQGALEGETGGAEEIAWSPVLSAEPTGETVPMWDLECEGDPANYVLASGLVCHNSYGFNKSHATSYGMIAYWSMWLKKRYPIEFYAALLRSEKDRGEIQRFVKDAKEHGVEVAPPDVNASGINFDIDDERNVIVAALSDIKNVGDAAARSIVENRPYKDFADFMARKGRPVNKRVVVSLVQAGAMNKLIPNARWFTENVDLIWDKFKTAKGREEAMKLIEESRFKPQWSEEERVLVASRISPLALGKHPMEAWTPFFNEHLRVPVELMGEEGFWKRNKHCYISGIMVERKYNQVGDFHTGALPSEAERARQKWGARYANINLEDQSDKQNRVKVDWDIFDDYREVVDAGIGTPIIAHVSLNAKFENMRAHFLVNVLEWHRKVKAGEPLTVWERILMGQHPALTYPWKSPALREAATRDISEIARKARRGFTVTGVVTHVKAKLDKRDNEMAWIGILGVRGFIEALCFGSSWPDFKDYVKPGRLITFGLEKSKDAIILDSDRGFIKLRNKVRSAA